MKIIVTGGAGFIGSAVIRQYIERTEHHVVNLDALTYAGNLESLQAAICSERYSFEHINICDKLALQSVFEKHQPDAVMHLAAESHVDRSIDAPADFIQTNIVGTSNLLETARDYWLDCNKQTQEVFKFHHVSTDEVYGELGEEGLFSETSPYQPNSPYSASKAASDHLVRAWSKTYGLPIIITNCSNNYGSHQFPEKLIPLITLNAIEGKPLPVYGKGAQIRDWLFVDDHAEALRLVIEKGVVGETYNIGGHNEMTNLKVVQAICQLLDDFLPESPHRPHEQLITFVADRPGHDFRYAINAEKIEHDLGWKPRETFETGIQKTVQWYLDNREWCANVLDGSYQRERLGSVL